MKKLFAVVLALILALSACAVGEAVGSIYLNPDFNLMVAMPSDWTIATSKDLGEGDELPRELSATYNLMQGTAGDGVENFIVDVLFMGSLASIMTEETLLDAVVNNITSSYAELGFTATSEHETIEFMGETHDTLLFTVNVYGINLIQRYAVVLSGEYAIEFTATGWSADTTLSMMNAVQKITK